MILSSDQSCVSEILRDVRLSSDSVRVLLYVLTSQDEYPDKELAMGLTRSGYIRVLRELESVGYLLRTRQRVGHRGWINERFWFDDPQKNQTRDSSTLVMDSQYIENPKTKHNVLSNSHVYDTYVSDDLILQNVSSVDSGRPTSLRSDGSTIDSENVVSENILPLPKVDTELGEFDEGLLSVALACGISLDAVGVLVERGIWRRVSYQILENQISIREKPDEEGLSMVLPRPRSGD